MKNNISLIIGDNATGKTRYLKNRIEYYIENEIPIVTNIQDYEKFVQLDKHKVESLENLQMNRYNNLIKHNNSRDYDGYVKGLYDLVAAAGNILILDELDYALKSNDVTLLCKAISETRHNWDAILVSGYSVLLDRLFKSEETDEYLANYYMIDNHLCAYSITEEQAYEYFDSL